MPRAFTRQLGNQPGVQLNPIQDRTDGAVLGTFDQTAALIGSFRRGRIDKPFRVNRGTLKQLLGKSESITISLLNEAYVHAYEALRNGARELVVQRLSVPGAVISWAVFTSAAASTFTVSATEPATTTHTFAVRHLGCHNDGIQIRVHAAQSLVLAVPAANPVITVVILDADDVEMFRFTGSLTQGSTDEFGQSNYLPDVAAFYTDMLEWNIPTGATIATTHDGYGKDSAGRDKYAASGDLICFTEGGTAYVSTDYDLAIEALRDSQHDYGYIMGGGTRATLLISKLADLAFDTNRQFVFDIPGEFTVAAAITWMQSFGFGTLGKDHYPQAYWAPLKSRDPLNGNIVTFGTSGAQVGYRCARNAVRNAYGLPAKNTPIAGRNGNLGRTDVRQIIKVSENDESDLADAHINPVIYKVFSSGGQYVFADQLTAANTVLSYRKLITTAEMSSHMDEAIARFARDILFLPREEFMRRAKAYLEKTFSEAYASEWLVDSDDPTVAPFAYTVEPDPLQPADKINIRYWLHYDGNVRQVHLQQYIV
jgi:hypothetical protein